MSFEPFQIVKRSPECLDFKIELYEDTYGELEKPIEEEELSSASDKKDEIHLICSKEVVNFKAIDQLVDLMKKT